MLLLRAGNKKGIANLYNSLIIDVEWTHMSYVLMSLKINIYNSENQGAILEATVKLELL
jgi:hypothetical protein